ncbi:MAG TPA: hypothetical protein VHE35_02590 [Kofleriaceae bacterium]|nr:hypothetical protein [Kofleriaceae bacterium]
MNLHLQIPGPRWHTLMLRAAAVLTLLALALMCWSVLIPTPLPVLVAMSGGQVFGTLAFAMYILVVVADLRRQYVRRKEIERSQKIPVVSETGTGTGTGTEENAKDVVS